MMGNFTIQIKVCAVLDVERKADDLQDAVDLGRQLSWDALLAKGVTVMDGRHKVVGVWDSNIGENLVV